MCGERMTVHALVEAIKSYRGTSSFSSILPSTYALQGGHTATFNIKTPRGSATN
jgi:hypothetical protein